MTRDEQIKKAAQEYRNDLLNFYLQCGKLIDASKEVDIPGEIIMDADCQEESFIEGAEWADRTMIEKACEWLHSALYLDHEHSIEHRYATLEELLNDFRKAMEGGEQ